ncbi:MAG: hypothetical protein II972_05930 [Elusimicrobiaceae bacterium]|nr:hypothetical protein [Elusimicrobiaceae bacterium]MBQ6224605.1 hypothetical protein [Campylobacter sp.]
MKYFLAILATLFVLGCASSQNQNSGSIMNSKNVVYDEEFDLLVAPEYDYESEVPYAEQIKITTKTTNVSVNNTTAKPAKQPVAIKVN